MELYRIANCFTDEEKQACNKVIAEFFVYVNGHYQNERQLQEYLYISRRMEASKENGRLGGRPKKPREISLYSPEYLAKKHGISIKDTQTVKEISTKEKSKVSFGFYRSLLVLIVLLIFISRSLYFAQSFIVGVFPGLEFYLNYFFESMRNVFEIWKSLIANY